MEWTGRTDRTWAVVNALQTLLDEELIQMGGDPRDNERGVPEQVIKDRIAELMKEL